MNIVGITGRITKDIEPKFGKDGMAIASFTVAVNRMKKGEADFITCKAFGKTAETIANYLGKGREISVTGHIQTGSYTNKSGVKVFTTDVIVDRFDFIGGNNGGQANNSKQEGIPSDYFGGDMAEVEDGADLPF